MAVHVTIDDLRRILREAAGDDAAVADLDGNVLDRSFEELGYDSLALLETSSRLEREYGIALGDSAVVDAETPRLLLEAVNARLAEASAV